MSILYTLPHGDWNACPDGSAAQSLEEGKILFFPNLTFAMKQEELALLSPEYSDANAKNISFNPLTQKVRGLHAAKQDAEALFENLLSRYCQQTQQFIKSLIPNYASALEVGRTSFRPVEIKGRQAASYRKDDTRLHVDAFPANPNQGKRILRIFCNINPEGNVRNWRTSASFEQVAETFLPQVSPQFFLLRYILKWLKITKSERTPYDSIMLNFHDTMKKSMAYQNSVAYTEINFPAQSTWIVYTDSVSHAALAGQYVLEQTFYLPVHAMHNENRSPLKILEKMTGKILV